MKPGLEKFVRRMKRLFVVLSVFAIPAVMVLLVFAFMENIVCIVCAPVLLVAYLSVYAAYALRVSMGTALGTQVTDKVVHVVTKRKTFTYDVKAGCVRVKKYGNRFVATFETQDSRDSFVFYRRAPFGGYEEQFSEDEIRAFCPLYDAIVENH